jgi:hypothetical protein
MNNTEITQVYNALKGRYGLWTLLK